MRQSQILLEKQESSTGNLLENNRNDSIASTSPVKSMIYLNSTFGNSFETVKVIDHKLKKEQINKKVFNVMKNRGGSNDNKIPELSLHDLQKAEQLLQREKFKIKMD